MRLGFAGCEEAHHNTLPAATNVHYAATFLPKFIRSEGDEAIKTLGYSFV